MILCLLTNTGFFFPASGNKCHMLTTKIDSHKLCNYYYLFFGVGRMLSNDSFYSDFYHKKNRETVYNAWNHQFSFICLLHNSKA